MSENKCWPEKCVWPEPVWNGEGVYANTDPELLNYDELDDDGKELFDIRAYFDEQVELGRLNPDYTLNEDYEDYDESWQPENGADYWDDEFLLEIWEEDMSTCINLLKIPSYDTDSPVSFIRKIINYDFINENILRQAFTRRAFQIEYGLDGCSEQLEFFGDTVLNTVVTREIYKRFTEISTSTVDAPFESKYSEGDLSKMRTHFVSKEYLSERAKELELDRFILYGSDENATDSSREDMMEALIGAVAVDSNWNWRVLEDVVDRLVNIQLNSPDSLLKTSYYEQFNSWHQRHFHKMPEYEIFRRRLQNGEESFSCSVRYFVPENDKDIYTDQRIEALDFPNRTAARERAAMMAVGFIQQNGLWVDLKNANLEPKLEDAINQLQELKQKKYVDEPKYTFEESSEGWECDCTCGGVFGCGRAANKTKAKKKAAFMVLVRLLKSAGLCSEELEHTMWQVYGSKE
ncbi:ribonuclease III domain-containing protein [Ruminococcus albus]|uniref:Ribonuclease 3 n=1 Tax=Ruminococcus albus TaxID=1264 RepID=A0A1I1CWB9_RUMAL|nr:ribonuclease III domain-containing protein [Ruminococcus albus]SFB66356.1 ribonuclease-3 [Ruminococcus albus]